jgi:hypothetical protein
LGDAAGLESAAIADGVPTAWFSAEIAANTAIEAIRGGDTSAAFLGSYDRELRRHPLITPLITDPHRMNLLEAMKSEDEGEMRRRVNQGWGIRVLGHLGMPITKAAFKAVRNDPAVLKSWMNMYSRYYHLYS